MHYDQCSKTCTGKRSSKVTEPNNGYKITGKWLHKTPESGEN